jgi:hypothetical protein
MRPDDYEIVEVLRGDEWVRAKFVPADYSIPEGDDDEIWWMNYFVLDDGTTLPEDIQVDYEDAKIQWRRLTGGAKPSE